jgi:hypothetical protein
MSNLVPTALSAALALQGVGRAMPIHIDAGRLFMKATPSLEGGRRVVYFEASKETRDYQGERILTEALAESIPYFLNHGRIDLDHGSVTGRVQGQRVNPYAMVIGRPVDAKVSGDSVWVKAEILSLEDPASDAVAMANYFWDTLRSKPPIQWYPSIHGLVLNDEGVVDADARPTQEVRRLLWQTVAFTQTPVNPAVSPVSMMPLRVFAKAFGEGRLMDFLGGGVGSSERMPSVNAVLPALEGQEDLDVTGILWALASGLASPADPFALTDGRYPRLHVTAVLAALADL